ncbi:MAG TPA: transglycosylase SLT domain-containing protein [Gemmatimonadales bacterium]|nr:transglycosylase SLT domain-containing protein [Gemmatimonadales bacterium]
MKRLLQLCPLVALAACAGQLPPAPTATPVSTAVHDSLAPVVDLDALTHESSAADAAVLNDLADATPSDAVVPAFDASGVRWDIDVLTYANHPRVRYYLDYFQGPARSRMEIFLSRGARYESLIRARFQSEGLPGDLGYLALIESGYSNEAVSRAYAVGMWQFMRGTGKGYGLRVDSWVDERRDPVKATDAAARHLRDLRERFGSLYLAAAAYNAGAGKVSRSLGKLEWDAPADPAATTGDSLDAAPEDADSNATDLVDADSAGTDSETADGATADGTAADSAAADAVEATTVEATTVEAAAAPVEDVVATPVQDITSDAAFFRLASSDLLATETQDYVPKLIAAAIIAKAPERYGFSSPTPVPLVYDSIVVHDATGLDVIARLAGSSLAEIRDLNPQYLRLATPPRSTMVVRLPAGTGPKVVARYEELSPKARVHYLTHVTGRGERLTAIAARYRLPVGDLRAANPKVRTNRPARGTRLVIPTVAIPSALAMRATGAIGSGHATYARGATHRVRPGETLTGIARRYRVSVRSLRRVNALAVHQTLRAGMRLRIPG